MGDIAESCRIDPAAKGHPDSERESSPRAFSIAKFCLRYGVGAHSHLRGNCSRPPARREVGSAHTDPARSCRGVVRGAAGTEELQSPKHGEEKVAGGD
jgi:hypothetical protein